MGGTHAVRSEAGQRVEQPGTPRLPSYIAGFSFRGVDSPEVAALYRCERRPPVLRLLLVAGVLLAVSAFWLLVFVIGGMFDAW